MDPLWILVAFILGFAVNRVRLPPLVGYLIAGFVLQALGVEALKGLLSEHVRYGVPRVRYRAHPP